MQEENAPVPAAGGMMLAPRARTWHPVTVPGVRGVCFAQPGPLTGGRGPLPLGEVYKGFPAPRRV
jgi:hypothetical protein